MIIEARKVERIDVEIDQVKVVRQLFSDWSKAVCPRATAFDVNQAWWIVKSERPDIIDDKLIRPISDDELLTIDAFQQVISVIKD